MEAGRRFAANMAASIIGFLVNIGIGLILPPLIVSRIGAEAYGFVALAQNMTGYATLLTVILNSVAGRFITVSYHQGDLERAERQFSSTIMADALMSVALTLAAVPVVAHLERLINIPAELIGDVKALFAFMFANLVLSCAFTAFQVATFLTDKLYLSSLVSIAGSLLRVALLVVLFSGLRPHVAYVGVATVASTLLAGALNMRLTHVLTPMLKFRANQVDRRELFHMLGAGVWNCVIRLQQMLASEAKLLLSNLLVGAYGMGMLSIAQILPNALNTLMITIASLFYPSQTRSYAMHDYGRLLKELKSGMRLCGCFTNIVLVPMLVAGRCFLTLWQPGQDTGLLYGLLVCSSVGFLASGVATLLQNVPLLLNRLKGYSLGWLVSSFLSLSLTLGLAILVPEHALWFIALVQPLADVLTNIVFVPLYTAKWLVLEWHAFYPIIVAYATATLCSIFVSLLIIRFAGFRDPSWPSTALMAGIAFAVTASVDCMVLLSGDERVLVLRAVKRIFRKEKT